MQNIPYAGFLSRDVGRPREAVFDVPCQGPGGLCDQVFSMEEISKQTITKWIVETNSVVYDAFTSASKSSFN